MVHTVSVVFSFFFFFVFSFLNELLRYRGESKGRVDVIALDKLGSADSISSKTSGMVPTY